MAVVEAVTPPHSMEAEQALLGALLSDNRTAEMVAGLVEPGDFYAADHAAIWRTAMLLVAANKPADVITVYDAGGHDLAYLNQLALGVASSSAAQAYARIVREHAVRRDVMRLGLALAEGARSASEKPAADLIDAAVTSLMSLQQRQAPGEPVPMPDMARAFLDDLTERMEGRARTFTTGLADLDRLTAEGGRPGELWVIGARPSMGKTAFMLSLCRHVGASHPVLVLTQEDSLLTLVARYVAAAGGINLADLRNPQAAPASMWEALHGAIDELSLLRIDTDDQVGLSLADVRRKIQQTKRRRGELALVVIDYLQLMQGDADNRNQMLGLIANGLKLAAKQFGVWIVLLSQLSREADKVNGPPQIGHLRDSGDIEGAADLIGMLYREHMRKPTDENKHLAELHVCKQKNGPTATLKLYFDGATQRFGNWNGGYR